MGDEPAQPGPAEPGPAEPGPAEPGAAEPGPAELARELIGEMRSLRHRARARRHAYWFPLVLFGLLIAASAPFYIRRAGPAAPRSGEAVVSGRPVLPMLGGFRGLLADRGLAWYWLAALLGGLLLTLLWYRWRGSRAGVRTPAGGHVLAVGVLTILAIAIPLLSAVRSPHWLSWLGHLRLLWPGDLINRGTFPFLIIAAGLWVLAWAERSLALTVISALYTAVAILVSLYDVQNVLFALGWNAAPGQARLTALPGVLLPALVLLLAGTAAFAVQRRHRTAS